MISHNRLNHKEKIDIGLRRVPATCQKLGDLPEVSPNPSSQQYAVISSDMIWALEALDYNVIHSHNI